MAREDVQITAGSQPGTISNEFGAYMNMYSDETGVVYQRRYAGGNRTGKDLLSDKSFWSSAGVKYSEEKQKSLTDRMKAMGLDPSLLDKAYGSSPEEIKKYKDRVRRVLSMADKKNITTGAFGGSSDPALQEEIRKLAKDAERFGETDFTMTPEKLKGLAGVSESQKAKSLFEWQNKNPGKNIGSMSPKDLAKLFGVSEKEITKDQIKEIKEFTSTDDFENYSNSRKIAQQSMDIAKQANEVYMDMLKKVKQPGYARNLANQITAPEQTAYDQFFRPTGGATISEAGKLVGEQEAALGRTGSTKAAEEMARQELMAKERLESRKTALTGQIQQDIDLNRPQQILSAGMQSGQTYPYYNNVYADQMLNPYKQIFPLMQQQQNMQLAPYSVPQQQQGPGALDYGLAGAQAGAQIIGSIYGAN